MTSNSVQPYTIAKGTTPFHGPDGRYYDPPYVTTEDIRAAENLQQAQALFHFFVSSKEDMSEATTIPKEEVQNIEGLDEWLSTHACKDDMSDMAKEAIKGILGRLDRDSNLEPNDEVYNLRVKGIYKGEE